MAFNPSPKVAAARNIAHQFGKKRVIVLMLTDDAMEYASYGETKELCNSAREIADIAFDAVQEWLRH